MGRLRALPHLVPVSLVLVLCVPLPPPALVLLWHHLMMVLGFFLLLLEKCRLHVKLLLGEPRFESSAGLKVVGRRFARHMATIRERLLAKKEQKDLEILRVTKGQPKVPLALKADVSDESAVLSRLMQMHRFA